jgi:hypothetical protein
MPHDQAVISHARCDGHGTDRRADVSGPASPPGEWQITFLGTGSAIPSKYRNVTGIHVQLRADGRGMLLDVGEGSLGQIRSVFSQDEAARCERGFTGEGRGRGRGIEFSGQDALRD